MELDRTNLEELVAVALRERGIKFLEQYPSSFGFVIDFVLEPNIALEADGPCHDSSKSRKRDRFRDKLLKNEGWKVYRIGYQVIECPEKLDQRLDEILARS